MRRLFGFSLVAMACPNLLAVRSYPTRPYCKGLKLTNSSIVVQQMRPENCTGCGDHEVCEEGSCVVEECGDLLPSSHGFMLGNLHFIGSKRKHVCKTGYQLGQDNSETAEILVCNGNGDWEPNIHECSEIDDCANNPCQHGTCTDLVAGYSCACLPGYSGVDCDENIDECVGVDCGHGECNDRINGYDCSCEVGYEGDHCETEIVDCDTLICESESDNYNNCAVQQAGRIISLKVQDQQSNSPCDSGISFGFSRTSIWVNRGCRAKFKVCYSLAA